MQSAGQVETVSPKLASHTLFPHVQSVAQVVVVSPSEVSHRLFPHIPASCPFSSIIEMHVGASSLERMGVEESIKNLTQEFKKIELPLKKKSNS